MSRAGIIQSTGAILTSSCNQVCPELTTGVGIANFALTGPVNLTAASFVTFQAGGAYQGGIETWAIGEVSSNKPIATGSIPMSQSYQGQVTVNGISLGEYSNTFALGSGVMLTSGSYYLSITDTQSPPDQFGIFWATTTQGLAYSLQSQAIITAPEPATAGTILAGLAGFAMWSRKKRSQAIRPS